MAKTVGDMTAAELRHLISATVEEKLVEILGDPDTGQVLREAVRKRLIRQKQTVKEGERGESFEAVVKRLKLS